MPFVKAYSDRQGKMSPTWHTRRCCSMSDGSLRCSVGHPPPRQGSAAARLCLHRGDRSAHRNLKTTGFGKDKGKTRHRKKTYHSLVVLMTVLTTHGTRLR